MTSQTPLILVMDDDRLVCSTARLMLIRLGYEVVLAADGESAIHEYARSLESDRPVSVAILDIKVVGGQGAVAAAMGILALDPEATLVVSSGSTIVPELVHFQDFGFAGRLAKPFLVGDLGMLVGELLD